MAHYVNGELAHEVLNDAQYELAKILDAYQYHRPVPEWVESVKIAQANLSRALAEESRERD